ncbi:MAG: carboxypeptidase regulatory-like domain-containing protein, partial [Acidobacteriia bacterium]|nr:carboxypeptidase regulatory-like domain-containing protein [Terriglobia bacterium]
TDPSGAVVPAALVQLRGPGGEKRQTTGDAGQYAFSALTPGKYLVRVIAKGFTVAFKPDLAIDGAAALDVQLTIQAESLVINVEDEARKVSTDPTAAANAGALILGQRELEALSDDPDTLAMQLQAMAGPAAGPSGGGIYVDGFSNGQIPPKSSIREVRINSNVYSPEYDQNGYGRIEIFTKPGSDKLRGQALWQYNKEALNSRSPLLAQSKRPQYKQNLYGVTMTGPLQKSKASFGLDAVRRSLTENAFILATTLDGNLNPATVNQTILMPSTVLNLVPRLDYSINANNNLTVRYALTRQTNENQGAGDFSLASRAYDGKRTSHVVQVTETAILTPAIITETRFQFIRGDYYNTGDNTVPAIIVPGAFTGGGPQIGNSGTTTTNWELANTSTYMHRAHSYKWGFRARGVSLESTSVNNFGGTFTFQPGVGPQLDGASQAIPGTSIALPALEVYRRTLLFQRAGMSDAQIRASGGGAYLFGISGGTPTTSLSQYDFGFFVNDDWRIRPNLTLGYGLRYETQTNMGDHGDWAPRVSLAWAPRARGAQQKTVFRAGFGAFYSRIGEGVFLNALRFNGVTQQSYLIPYPPFYPAIPSLTSLASARQPQQLQLVYGGIVAPRTYQASVGGDRQIGKYARVSVSYVETRAVHVQRVRDINAPLGGQYPFGDPQLRRLTESTGFSRMHQVMITPTVNYKKLTVFGYYVLGFNKTDSEGQPADPYNLRAEWGPSAGDARHMAVAGARVMLPLQISALPYFLASSGRPYNITTGRDLNGDTVFAERPALASGAGNCSGKDSVYAAQFGCFNLSPGPGAATIGRNFARGPAMWNVGQSASGKARVRQAAWDRPRAALLVPPWPPPPRCRTRRSWAEAGDIT